MLSDSVRERCVSTAVSDVEESAYIGESEMLARIVDVAACREASCAFTRASSAVIACN